MFSKDKIVQSQQDSPELKFVKKAKKMTANMAIIGASVGFGLFGGNKSQAQSIKTQEVEPTKTEQVKQFSTDVKTEAKYLNTDNNVVEQKKPTKNLVDKASIPNNTLVSEVETRMQIRDTKVVINSKTGQVIGIMTPDGKIQPVTIVQEVSQQQPIQSERGELSQGLELKNLKQEVRQNEQNIGQIQQQMQMQKEFFEKQQKSMTKQMPIFIPGIGPSSTGDKKFKVNFTGVYGDTKMNFGSLMPKTSSISGAQGGQGTSEDNSTTKLNVRSNVISVVYRINDHLVIGGAGGWGNVPLQGGGGIPEEKDSVRGALGIGWQNGGFNAAVSYSDKTLIVNLGKEF
jgi:hypothetical protein